MGAGPAATWRSTRRRRSRRTRTGRPTAARRTMSYLTQMAGLAYHNFVSAAVGIAARHRVHPGHRAPGERDARQLLGRSHARVAVGAAAAVPRRLARCWCRRGSCRTCRPYDRPARRSADRDGDGRGRPGDDDAVTAQVIAQGPVASQEIIKELGTNGGGFFNANSAHPVREPDAADQLPRDDRHLRHPAGAGLHARRR